MGPEGEGPNYGKGSLTLPAVVGPISKFEQQNSHGFALSGGLGEMISPKSAHPLIILGMGQTYTRGRGDPGCDERPKDKLVLRAEGHPGRVKKHLQNLKRRGFSPGQKITAHPDPYRGMIL